METRTDRERALARAREKRYKEKKGIINKSYPLPKSTVDAFAKACKSKGVYISHQLNLLMQEYINAVTAESNKEG